MAREAKMKKRRTSWNGWRIVAGGVLILIFGFSMFFNDIGPRWMSGSMLLAGIAVVFYGRTR